MTRPRATRSIKIDWSGDGFGTGAYDDVTADNIGRSGEALIDLHQPIDLRYGQAGPAQCTIQLQNRHGRYTPGNASSPIASQLKPGRRVRVTASPVAGGGPYAVFDGFIRRIVPHGGPPSERSVTIIAEDALFRAQRKRETWPADTNRSLHSWRTDIATALGFAASNQRDIDTSGDEIIQPITFSDDRGTLELLNELSRITGSIHYVRPSDTESIGAIYRSRARLPIVHDLAAVATFTGAQVASLEGYELGDENIANRITAAIAVRQAEPVARDLAIVDEITVGGSSTRTEFVSWADPALSISSAYTAVGCTVTVTLLGDGRRAKVEITGTGSGGSVSNLVISGIVASDKDEETINESSPSSIASYGEWAGTPAAGDYYGAVAQAQSRALHLIGRLGDGPAMPTVIVDSIMPQLFTVMPGDRITVSNGTLPLPTPIDLLVGTRRITMLTGGYWMAAWECEQLKPRKTLFKLGGTAAEGIGGTGVTEH